MGVFVYLRFKKFGFMLLSHLICNITPKDMETHSNVEIVGVTLCAFYDTALTKNCSKSAF